MAAPIMYTRDDAGSPTLTFGGAGEPGITTNWMNNIRAIMRACLVTGYGGKAAAGWTIESESPTHLLLRNGPGTGYAFFRTLNNVATCELFLAASVTAVIDGQYGKAITGSGIKSGVNPMLSNESANYAQRISLAGSFVNTVNTNWMLVADDKTLIFMLSSMQTSGLVNIGYTDPYGMLSLYIGEDTAGNFISVGGCNSNSTGTSITHKFRIVISNDDAGITVLRNPFTGALLTATTVTPLCPSLYAQGTLWTEEYTIDRITLGKVPWQYRDGAQGVPYVFCGNLRGIAWANEIAMNGRFDYNLKAMGWTGTPASLRNNPKLPLDATYDYRLMFIYRTSAQGGIMTNNPAFW